MRRAWVLLALTGCSSIFGLHAPAHGTVTDGPAGDSVDATDGAQPDGLTCVGHGALAVCFDAPPTQTVTLAPTINTGAADVCKTGAHWVSNMQPDACFIFGQTVMQSGTTAVTGPRPLVVIATDRLEIDGLLDASSHLGGTVGPDAAPTSCGGFGATPGTNSNGGGGGAGGSFISSGGTGGTGNGGSTAGGQPATVVTPSLVLRGGCDGQAGSAGMSPTEVGPAGSGGGALYLASGNLLVISAGQIAANGAGAGLGRARAGGSGGGAGGMIVLDAPAITATNALLSANGGGGAAGADGNTGIDGTDPDPASPDMPAAGGGVGRGGPGGAGAAAGLMAGNGGDVSGGLARGGGGGGGGIGVIYAPMMTINGTASPAITILP